MYAPAPLTPPTGFQEQAVLTFAIVNQKGGCGKTTTAINLAGVFAGRGYRTLLVDMDPQGHCAAGLAIPENRIDLHIGDAMLAEANAPVDARRLLWRVSRNLDLAPSTVRLAAVEATHGGLAGKPDAERRLKQALVRFDSQYDLSLIDCSPAIGLLAFNALVAADEVLIPVETGFFSLQGATKQVNAIKSIGKRLGIAPVHRILATMHDPVSGLSKDLLEELRRRFTSRVIPVVIRYDQSLKEAASFGQPVVEYSPESQGAQDYMALADWLTANALASGRQTHADEPEPAQPCPAEQASPIPAAPGPIASPLAGVGGGRAADLVSRARKLQARAAEAAVPNVSARPLVPAAAVIEIKSTPPAEPAVIAPPLASAGPSVLSASRHTVGFGPHVTPYGVTFRAPPALGRSVAVAGDFNQWMPERTVMRLNDGLGILEAVAFMPPGSTAQYRLVVDGQWIADPYNPSVSPNPFGGTNSVVSVPMMTAEMLGASTALHEHNGSVVVRNVGQLSIGRPA